MKVIFIKFLGFFVNVGNANLAVGCIMLRSKMHAYSANVSFSLNFLILTICHVREAISKDDCKVINIIRAVYKLQNLIIKSIYNVYEKCYEKHDGINGDGTDILYIKNDDLIGSSFILLVATSYVCCFYTPKMTKRNFIDISVKT